jgi:hypothetical protein
MQLSRGLLLGFCEEKEYFICTKNGMIPAAIRSEPESVMDMTFTQRQHSATVNSTTGQQAFLQRAT